MVIVFAVIAVAEKDIEQQRQQLELLEVNEPVNCRWICNIWKRQISSKHLVYAVPGNQTVQLYL
jgi:hypothetical protein